jgi:hypothetical protein
MRVVRIINIGPSCRARGRLHQVAELSGGRYALVIGDIFLERGAILPIDPGDSGTIDYYDDLSQVQRAWEDREDVFAAHGDRESADNMGAAAAVWDVADEYQLGNALSWLSSHSRPVTG